MKKLFTLIELITVIVVMGILAAIVIPNISSLQQESTNTAILSNVKNLQTGVDIYSNKNHGTLPGVTMPTELHPSPIDYDKMKPEYIRNTPKTKGMKYWVDVEGIVWASSVDSPLIELKPNPTDVNKVKIEWEPVLNSKEYRIYELENYNGTEGMLAGKASARKGKLVLVDTIVTNKYENGQRNTAYLVSSVDYQGFESSPSGVGYLGYDNLVPSSEPKVRGFENVLDSTVSLPTDSLRSEINLVVDENGTTYAFFLKNKNLVFYTIDRNGNISPEKLITDKGLEQGRLRVKLVGDHFYASNFSTSWLIRIHKIKKDGTLVSTEGAGGWNIHKFDVEASKNTGFTYAINDEFYSSSTNTGVLTKSGGTRKVFENAGTNNVYGFDVAIDSQENIFTLYGRRSSNVDDDKIIFQQYNKDLLSTRGKNFIGRPNEIQTTQSLVDKEDNVYFLTSTPTMSIVYKTKYGQDPVVAFSVSTSISKMLPTEEGVGFNLIYKDTSFNQQRLIKYKYDGEKLSPPSYITQVSSFNPLAMAMDSEGNIVTSRYSDGREIIYIKKEN